MIQFIVVSSCFLHEYISFIFLWDFSFVVFSLGVVVSSHAHNNYSFFTTRLHYQKLHYRMLVPDVNVLAVVLLMKFHLQSYPCPLQINAFWNLGFLLGITIILQVFTGIFLGLHYTSDLNSAYSSLFLFIREILYGWCLRYLHFSGDAFFSISTSCKSYILWFILL